MSAWIQALAATAGFVFLAMQILLERKAKRFEIYEHIGGRFTELLWREADDEALQGIWEPCPRMRTRGCGKHTRPARRVTAPGT